jgi:SAM-dependent methyltransferase
VQRNNAERWDEIFASSEGDISEPLGYLVEELDRLSLRGRALDLGCGAGRHCIQLANRGFETHGLDVSRQALHKTALNMRAAGLSAHLKLGEMQSLPYRDGLFDLIVSINVIHHNDSGGAQGSASEVRRVLKPGGYLIATIAAVSHHNFGMGEMVAEKTFLRQSGVEAGILHYFMEEEDVRAHFKGFEFERLSEQPGSCFFREMEGKDNYHWFLTARKKT